MAIYKLKDLIQEVISGEWGEEVSDDSTGINVIRTTNFSNTGKLNLDKEVAVRKIEADRIAKKHLIAGDTIIEKSGGSPDQPVGRVVFFEEDGMYLCNNFTSILRPNKDLVEPKYLMYLFFNLYRQRKVLRFQNKTTGIINLKLDQYLNKTEVDIPSKEIQLKIVNALDKAFHLIEKRQSKIVVLDELTKSVFFEMFGDIVLNSKKYKQVPLVELMDSIIGGGTPSKSNMDYYRGNIPWVTPKDMKKMYIQDSKDHINEEAIQNSSAKLIPEKSLLMVIRSGILKKQLPLAINTTQITINQDMKALVPKEELIKVEYLFMFFKMYERILLQKVRAVTADNINFGDIKNLNIPLPPYEEQRKYVGIFNRIQGIKNIAKTQLKSQELLYNSILQNSFKGELFQEQA